MFKLARCQRDNNSRTAMKPHSPDQDHARVDREVARERHERTLNDDARAGLALDDEFRMKDARESMNSSNLRRPS
jgi:hypothetical protein